MNPIIKHIKDKIQIPEEYTWDYNDIHPDCKALTISAENNKPIILIRAHPVSGEFYVYLQKETEKFGLADPKLIDKVVKAINKGL